MPAILESSAEDAILFLNQKKTGGRQEAAEPIKRGGSPRREQTAPAPEQHSYFLK